MGCVRPCLKKLKQPSNQNFYQENCQRIDCQTPATTFWHLCFGRVLYISLETELIGARSSEQSPLGIFTASRSHRRRGLPPSWIEGQQCSLQDNPDSAHCSFQCQDSAYRLALHWQVDGTAWVMMFPVPQVVTSDGTGQRICGVSQRMK